MFFKTKDSLIFSYVLEKHKCSENIEKCMELVVDRFLNTYYYSHVVEFKGDLSPFHKFEEIFNHYFEI